MIKCCRIIKKKREKKKIERERVFTDKKKERKCNNVYIK